MREMADRAFSTLVSDALLGVAMEATHLIGFFPAHLWLNTIIAVYKMTSLLGRSENRKKITDAVHRLTHGPGYDPDVVAHPMIRYAASAVWYLVTGFLLVVACHCILFAAVTSCYAFTLGTSVVKAWRDVSPTDFPEDFAAHVRHSTSGVFTEFQTITASMRA
jgi:hypothetical protein